MNRKYQSPEVLDLKLIELLYMSLLVLNAIQDHVHKTSLYWMGRLDGSSPFFLPTLQEVGKKYCQTRRKENGSFFDLANPHARPFKLDMQATPSAAWNKRCAVVFALGFVKLSDSHSQDVEKVRNHFKVYMKSLKQQ
jgi:hypothetical protein